MIVHGVKINKLAYPNDMSIYTPTAIAELQDDLRDARAHRKVLLDTAQQQGSKNNSTTMAEYAELNREIRLMRAELQRATGTTSSVETHQVGFHQRR